MPGGAGAPEAREAAPDPAAQVLLEQLARAHADPAAQRAVLRRLLGHGLAVATAAGAAGGAGPAAAARQALQLLADRASAAFSPREANRGALARETLAWMAANRGALERLLPRFLPLFIADLETTQRALEAPDGGVDIRALKLLAFKQAKEF